MTKHLITINREAERTYYFCPACGFYECREVDDRRKDLPMFFDGAIYQEVGYCDSCIREALSLVRDFGETSVPAALIGMTPTKDPTITSIQFEAALELASARAIKLNK